MEKSKGRIAYKDKETDSFKIHIYMFVWWNVPYKICVLFQSEFLLRMFFKTIQTGAVAHASRYETTFEAIKKKQINHRF